MFIGVDIGGTFTDLVLSQDGRLHIHKLLSTPDNPARAMLAGLEAVGAVPGARISHGSTVATNAILERKGAKTALITTQGFRDLLFIGRQNRPELYALQPQLPPPLIPRQWCYEVPERLDYTGAVLTPLDMAALDGILDDLEHQGIESVAVCFLYSYINPAHELAVRQRILERGILQGWQISLSCEVLPEFREYERASTVALDAYVRPVMSRYLQTLEDALPHQSKLLVMKSDGGVISAKATREQAIQTALSGPAAGIIGAFHLAQLAGFDHIISLDMGGTSTDVTLCPGAPMRRPESEIDGLPLRIRIIDIETIGAGGGSIARLDAGGALRVGPESAGANPGPIIYGRGGQLITVSDANAILGRLDGDHFLGGRMKLDLDSAHSAVEQLAAQMGLTPAAVAKGIIDVANANIDRALRRVSIARGYDPRDFTLMAFGGAGPLHACEAAERLDIPRVLIPRYPGVLCALGLLFADVLRDYSRTILQPLTEKTPMVLKLALDDMLAQAQLDLANEGIPEGRMAFQPTLDMRYQGQSFELNVPIGIDMLRALHATKGSAELTPLQDFHAAHERAYGHAMRSRAVEVVNLRLEAIGSVDKPLIEPESFENARHISSLGRNGEMDLYDRESLLPGATLSGPALVFQLDSTCYIAPGWSAQVDSYRNLVLSRL